jgi:hypothetical protein
MVEGKSYVCEKCGVTVEIGDYPFCKGGHKGGWYGAEEPCEEFIDENITSEPGGMTFTSKRAWVHEMDKKGHVPATFRSDPNRRIARGPTGKLLFVDMGSK